MRLISCYIENFGGLQKFSYEFRDGLNVIFEANGWGKSTLAAFLKAMFYGLERTTKRSLDENERKKYEPWNGGIYGGNLVFEADGCGYRIERFFGIKDKEDSFALYDVNTGLKSDAYTEEIGEELFGIDRVAFEQSVFMKQGMYSVSMTDSVTAKLSGLMASGDDVDCYEKACARLDAEMKQYKKIGNKGRIPELTEEIAMLNRRIAEGKQINASINEWKNKEKQCRSEIESLMKSKADLKEKMLRAGEQAGLLEKRKNYNSLLEEKEQLRQKLERMDSFFQSGVPTEEELEEYRNKLFLYKHSTEESQTEEKEYKYPRLVSLLVKNPMSEEETDACEQKWNEVKEKENLLEKKTFQCQTLQEVEKENKERLIDKINSIKTKLYLAIALAVLALVTAVVLYFTVDIVYVFIGIGVFVVATICAVIFCRQWKMNVMLTEDTNEELQQLEAECEELSQNIIKGKKAVRMYLQAFSVTDEDEIPALLNQIRISLLEIKTEKEKKADRIEAETKRRKEKEILRGELIVFLRKFYRDIDEPEEFYFKELWQKQNDYIHLGEQFELKCKQLADSDMVEIIPETEILSMEKLQDEESILEQKIREQESTLHQVKRTLEHYGEMIEECEKLEMEKQDAELLLAEYTERYKILEKTLKYLKAAQNEFSSRYLKKMNEGFAKYATLFREGVFEQSALDVKLSVKSEEGGIKRDIGYYSVGLRETMELCTRFALIEALYEKEEPFVVLDDPFVNLGEKSLDGSKKVLMQIAERYQLIYFTCHPSRQ